MNKRSKLLAVTASAALAVGALAGCSGGSGGDGDKVTITWWHNGTGEPLLSFWQGVADDFEKDHPNVTVKVEAYQNEELQRTLIPNALRSGSGVDLFQQWGAGELAAQVRDRHPRAQLVQHQRLEQRAAFLVLERLAQLVLQLELKSDG